MFKKAVNAAFIYAVCAMVGGVFYREFTKFTGFAENSRTALGFVHTHLFLLGMVFMLLAALLSQAVKLNENGKLIKWFWITYNIGVPITAVMLALRGITQVLAMPLSNAFSAAISGIAGIGHILTGMGIILFFVALRKSPMRSAK